MVRRRGGWGAEWTEEEFPGTWTGHNPQSSVLSCSLREQLGSWEVLERAQVVQWVSLLIAT